MLIIKISTLCNQHHSLSAFVWQSYIIDDTQIVSHRHVLESSVILINDFGAEVTDKTPYQDKNCHLSSEERR